MEAREDAKRHLALKQSTRKVFLKKMERDVKPYQEVQTLILLQSDAFIFPRSSVVWPVGHLVHESYEISGL